MRNDSFWLKRTQSHKQNPKTCYLVGTSELHHHWPTYLCSLAISGGICLIKFAPRWSMLRPLSSLISAGKCSNPFPLKFNSSILVIFPKSAGKPFIRLCFATSTLRWCSLHISGGNSLKLFWETSSRTSWAKSPTSGGRGESWLPDISRWVVSSFSSLSFRSFGSCLSPRPLRESSLGREGVEAWYEDTWKLIYNSFGRRTTGIRFSVTVTEWQDKTLPVYP